MGFPVLTELASNVEESLLNGQFELAIENANQFIKTCEQFTEGQ